MWRGAAIRGSRRWAAAVAVIGAALLVSCAIPRPGRLANGMTESEVVALMGSPTDRYAMAKGATRLEFAQGPAGRETWMVDFDADGRMTESTQVLDPWYFQQVTDGMSRDTLLRWLGRPGYVLGAWRDRKLWYWRYPNNDCLIAVAMLGADGRVEGGVSMMPDPACNDTRGQ